MDPTQWVWLDHILGPRGGELALAFGAGCTAGWAFCMRTLYKVLKERRDAEHEEAKARAAVLESELKQTNERLFGEMRQLSQVRESSFEVLDTDGKFGSPNEPNIRRRKK